MTYPDSVRLALACALLTGCASTPTFSVEPEAPVRGRAPLSPVSIQIEAPAGVIVGVDGRGSESSPLDLPVDVDEQGNMTRTIRLTVDFSAITPRGFETTSSVVLRSGERPPRRVVFSRANSGTIVSKAYPRAL